MTVSAAEARELALKKLSSREPITGEYPVRLEHEPAMRLTRARLDLDELEEETTPDPEKVAAAEAELVAAQEQVDEATIVMTFTSLAPEDFDKLVEQFPPTKEEIEADAERGFPRPEYSDAFRPALVAATCTFPGFVDAAEAKACLWGGRWHLTREEVKEIFKLALAVCRGRRDVNDWGKDFARSRA